MPGCNVGPQGHVILREMMLRHFNGAIFFFYAVDNYLHFYIKFFEQKIFKM